MGSLNPRFDLDTIIVAIGVAFLAGALAATLVITFVFVGKGLL